MVSRYSLLPFDLNESPVFHEASVRLGERYGRAVSCLCDIDPIVLDFNVVASFVHHVHLDSELTLVRGDLGFCSLFLVLEGKDTLTSIGKQKCDDLRLQHLFLLKEVVSWEALLSDLA